MRAKQATTQLPQSSLAQTILPSAANDRGRKSRRAEAPEPVRAPPVPPAPAAVPEPLQAPTEFTQAPTAPVWAPPPAQTAAPVWAPPPSAPAPAAAPDWGMTTSRFGNAPAAFGNAPANPQFASAPVTDYPTSYPAAPGFPPQPQYADTPGAGYLAPVTAGQWVPQHGGSQFGAPQSAPPSYGPPTFGAPGYSGYPIGATPGRSTASRVLIALAITVAAFVGIGILAAIAIPVFANKHHPKTVARLALLPDTLVDQQKIVSPEFSGDTASQIAQLRRTIPDVLQANAAYYGQGGLPVFSVAAGNLYPSPTAADAKSFFGTSAGAGSISFTPVGSGPYGGWMECGGGTVNGQPMTTCASLDNAAVVIVSAANTTPSDLAILTRQIITSVEIKG
jgi:hypothetical protein